VLVYAAAGLLFEPDAPQFTVVRRLSADRVIPGQPVEVAITLTNNGTRLEEVALKDNVPTGLKIVDGQTELLTSLEAGQTLTLAYTVMGQRGLYRFDEVEVTVRDALGLFQKSAAFSAANQFFVLPEFVKVKQVAIRPPRTGIYAGLIPARQGGPGVEFFGLREYRPGDPVRWVNARASARHQQTLFVNEFQQERVVDIGLILDARRLSDARARGQSLFEYGIQTAATLADAFLEGGNRVGLFIYGRSVDWTFPGFGKVQRERIIRALARARQGDGRIFESLEHLPARLFPVRSQLVFISPLLSDDLETLIRLRARGYRLLVISPDPVAFERKGLPDSEVVGIATQIAYAERQSLLRSLKQADIQVVDWDVATPFHQVAHIALSRAAMPLQRGRVF
jgi:uncharacterized protein (DUF58 family)